MFSRSLTLLAAGFLASAAALAQITPAEGYTPPNDDPTVRVGITIFADYTWMDAPEITDADGNRVSSNSFNVNRAYLNVTGQLHHLLSFRITPDVVRESGSGSSISGSQTFRLKYAYAQFNMDDWLPRGTWVRLGVQQTPYVDFNESVYRYRFQGSIFVEREGFLSSSDAALSARFAFPLNYGDVHVGVYNGEGYTRSEQNDQKAFMVRATVRPAPGVPVLRGLRVTGFYDTDHYVRDAERRRAIGFLSFEHAFVNAGVDYIKAQDQATRSARSIKAEGWSAFLVPRTPIGIEGLLRYEEIKPDTEQDDSRKKKRFIGGVAYWFPFFKTGATAALLADYEKVKYERFSPARPEEKRYALHMLLNF